MSRTLRPADFVSIYAAARDALIIAAYRAARNRGTLVQGVTAPAVEDRVELETAEYGELIACIHAPQLVLIYGPAGFVCVSEGEGIEVEDDSLDDPMFEDDDEDSEEGEEAEEDGDGDEEDDGYVECAVCRHAIGSTEGCRDCQNYNETKDDENVENDEADALDAYIADGEAAGARAEDWDAEDLVEGDVGDPVESAESTRFVGTIDEFYADIKADPYGSAGSIWRYIMGAPREPLVVLQCNVAPAAIRVVTGPRKGLNQGDALADALDSQWGGEFDNWVIEIELLRVGHARNPLVMPLVTFTFGNYDNRKQD